MEPIKKRRIQWGSYFIAIGVVVVATVIDYFMLFPLMTSSNLVMVYLLGITVVAVFGQVGPSILTSVLSVLAYDFFFIPPYFSFAVSDVKYLFTLAVMLIVGQVITQLTLLSRRQAESARLSAQQVSALYTLSRQLSKTRGTEQLLKMGAKYISDAFNCDVMGLLPREGHLSVCVKTRTDHALNEKEQGIAEWVYEIGQKAGLGTDSLSFSEALFMPLQGSQSVMGVLRLHPENPDRFLEPETIHLLEACANQIALAIEVDRLQENAKKTELKAETDRARSTLLRSFSQDLRTPLRSIIESATSQMQMASDLDPQSIMEFGKDIYLETEQLSRLINNMLQSTYFEYENITLHKEMLSIRNAIMTVVQASERKLGNRPIYMNIPNDLPLIPFDTILIQEVLINLLDNAIKFTPKDTPIEFHVTFDQAQVIVSVVDHGPGIMPDEMDKLFDKFYRGRLLTKERGLGLGLAICYTIIHAHGGEIGVQNAEDGGAIFFFSMPRAPHLPAYPHDKTI
jgi:two-component system sensor histidine kinase KdpD